ncbi:cellulose synthase family protein [Pontibacter virosus]|uniref:Cellulose synthase/poly-beta-1,6-N-acetylglucosamine synthase-like glycosyltransferase n=1 Tax=Pontibacter virosus TaxID=1765052 RepID=A0A2U1AXX5_9BACT|nr:cellulose synthase family protein [Pontibacter virosus]PVY41268.1 cellulose synthase/poly-beta-1,6-N-acetylglucosamine synthase-like glycosyltransferase [Pontibacter virosus]
MTFPQLLLVAVYGLCLAFIFCYSLVQLHLTYLYWTRRRTLPEVIPDDSYAWPAVTVQLPLYNERYVVERLIDAVAALDYPRHLLQIQLLDDSTDDTSELIRQKMAHYAGIGLRLEHVRRPDRSGYKAGALQYGLQQATGEFIAIFDADFVPNTDFLKRTIPAFTNDRVGVVQTRWGHLNQGYSLLTRLQAFGLDAHFTIEQVGRNNGGHFINFNGTAGVWRKSCIVDAGGWQSDTLTEDLDLSYRAQLRGWHFRYLQDVTAPAELPAAMGALKSQQYRWTKGAAETARKHLGKVLRAPMPFTTRLHAIFHLLNSGIFVCVLLTALLSLPMLYLKHSVPGLELLFAMGSLLIVSLLALLAFYWTSIYQQTGSFKQTAQHFIPEFFLFLSLSMGMSLHNTVAVLEGYLGRKTPFIRTPKYNLQHRRDSWRQHTYTITSLHPVTLLEGLLTVYFGYGILVGFQLQDYGLLPFHVMLTLGFGSVFVYSLNHSRRA